jgi:hypothetical protein
MTEEAARISLVTPFLLLTTGTSTNDSRPTTNQPSAYPRHSSQVLMGLFYDGTIRHVIYRSTSSVEEARLTTHEQRETN